MAAKAITPLCYAHCKAIRRTYNQLDITSSPLDKIWAVPHITSYLEADPGIIWVFKTYFFIHRLINLTPAVKPQENI
jgi:hypothetical protein